MNAVALLKTGERIPLTDPLERARTLWRDGRYDDGVVGIEPGDEDVKDIVRGELGRIPGKQTAEEADVGDGLLALLGGVGDTQPSAREELGVLSGSGISQLAFAEFAQER